MFYKLYSIDEDENINKINNMILKIDEYLKQIVEANWLNKSIIFEDSIFKNDEYKNKKEFLFQKIKIYNNKL